MRLQAGYDIVVPVAVHIVGVHLRSAWTFLRRSLPAQGCGMKGPRGIRRGGGVFPPAPGEHQVEAPVAIDVPGADAMRIRAPVLDLGDAMQRPGGSGFGPIGRYPTA